MFNAQPTGTVISRRSLGRKREKGNLAAPREKVSGMNVQRLCVCFALMRRLGLGATLSSESVVVALPEHQDQIPGMAVDLPLSLYLLACEWRVFLFFSFLFFKRTRCVNARPTETDKNLDHDLINDQFLKPLLAFPQ